MGEPNIITVQITGYSLQEVCAKMADFINSIKGINLLVRRPVQVEPPQPGADCNADKNAD